MANIKFSQFTVETAKADVDFLVGYSGPDNVQISPTNLLADYPAGSGAAGQVTFFSAASTITGDNNLYWDNTNKRLGIGTSTPGNILEVKTPLGAANMVGLFNGTMRLQLGLNNSAGAFMFVQQAYALRLGTGNTERMRVTAGGDVGIGTTTPAAKLHVDGTLIATGISQLGSGGSNVLLTSSSAGNVGIGISSPESKLHVGPSALLSGYTTTATTLAISDITNGAELILRGQSPRIFFDSTSSGNAEMYLDGYQFDILSGRPDAPGSSRFYINASGNVGIGTTSPTYKLQVAGKSYLSGGIQLNSGDEIDFGNSNQYITGVNDTSLTLATGGSATLTATHSGNVGIGTTSPPKNLTIDWSSADTNVDGGNGLSGGTVGRGLLIRNNDTTLNNYANLDFRANSADGRIAYTHNGTNDGDFHFITDNLNNTGTRLFIGNSGNVGIGTTSPSAKLTVASGDVEVTLNTKGIILKSPDGTRYRITVANGGSLTSTALP